MSKFPQYDTRKTRYWREPLEKGRIGVIEKSVTGFRGKRVSYVGRWGGYSWLKLLEPADNCPAGQVFCYLTKWVKWE